MHAETCSSTRRRWPEGVFARVSQTTVYDTCFAYGDRLDFFDDPFLMSDVDSAQVMTVSDPQRQARVRASGTTEAYGRALEIAQANLARLSEAGVPIAFGTDAEPLGRIQGGR